MHVPALFPRRHIDAILLACLWVLILAFILYALSGCRSSAIGPADVRSIPQLQFEVTGEDFLISTLDELQSIAEWAEKGLRSGSVVHRSGLGSGALAPEADTVYMYGDVGPDGYGAVVTERHAYPKGILLITLRRSHGGAAGKVVTETKRYISYASLLADRPEQSTLTEVSGLSRDTIMMRVVRNGRVETFTLRLPVITRTTNLITDSVRVTTRYGEEGAVVSEITDGSGNLIQIRRNYGQADGSLMTRTEYPDGSWRMLRVLGQSDGSVVRETTVGSGR